VKGADGNASLGSKAAGYRADVREVLEGEVYESDVTELRGKPISAQFEAAPNGQNAKWRNERYSSAILALFNSGRLRGDSL